MTRLKLQVRSITIRPVLLACVLIAGPVSGLAGCSHLSSFSSQDADYEQPNKLKIVALGNQDVIKLSADDVVRVMRRAGFSDEQILELGPELRDGLAESGAAQVRLRDKVEVVFAVHGNYVFITSRLRGSFIYDVGKGWVQLERSAQGS
jgi:hypothetical protein